MEAAVYRLALDADRPVESLTRALDTAQMQIMGQYRKLSLTGAVEGGDGGTGSSSSGSGSESDECSSVSLGAASVANYVPLLVAVDSDLSVGGSVTVKSEFIQKRRITEGRTYRVAPPAAKLPGNDANVVLVAIGAASTQATVAGGAAATAAGAHGALRGGASSSSSDAAIAALDATIAALDATGVAASATPPEASFAVAGRREEERSALATPLDGSATTEIAASASVGVGSLSNVSLTDTVSTSSETYRSFAANASAISSAPVTPVSSADASHFASDAAPVAPAAPVQRPLSSTQSADVSSAVSDTGGSTNESSAAAFSGSMSTVSQSSVSVSTTAVSTTAVVIESISAEPAAAAAAGTNVTACDSTANLTTTETAHTSGAIVPDDDEAEAAAIALRYRQSFEEAAARFERLAALGGAGDAPPPTEASAAASSLSSRALTGAAIEGSPVTAAGDSSSDDAGGGRLPPSFVPASDESTTALWKAVDAFKQASTMFRTTGDSARDRAIEAGLCGDQLVLGYFSDATSSPSSAAGGGRVSSKGGAAGTLSGASAAAAIRDKRRSDGLERAAAAATERRTATMRAVHSASSFGSGAPEAARADLMRRSRTETLVSGATADGSQQFAATTKSSSGSSGSGGGSSSIRNSGSRSRDAPSDAESRDGKRGSPNATPTLGSRGTGEKNGSGGDRNGTIDNAAVIRRNGLQYASFRQIRPPSAAIAADGTRKSSTTRRSMTTTTTVTTNIYQLSVLPVFGSPAAKDQLEPGHCSVLRNYTKGRPFVTYSVRLAIRDVKFDNGSNLLISTRSSILMFDVNGYLLGEVFRDSIGEPYGLFVCENNHVLVADCKRSAVLEFDVMGRVVKMYGPVAAPAGVAMARDGRVFACSRWSRHPPCVAVFSPEGELLGRVGDEYLENPVSIALHGSLTIVCDGHYTVGIDRRGQVQFVYGREPSPGEASSLPSAASVAVDVEGYVLVTDYCHHSVCGMTPEVDQAGVVLGEANECRHPCFVAASRFGHLAVVERHEGIYRVKLYKRNEKALKAK